MANKEVEQAAPSFVIFLREFFAIHHVKRDWWMIGPKNAPKFPPSCRPIGEIELEKMAREKGWAAVEDK